MPTRLPAVETGSNDVARTPTRALVMAAAVVAVALAALPLWVVHVPPLGDYLSHLAAVALLEDLRLGGFVAKHYAIGSVVVPDILFDVVVGGLGLLLPLELAGKLFILLTFVLLVGGTLLLHRTIHGRLSLWPLVAALLLYNWIFLFGFMSYVAGVGVMLVALALWLRSAQRPWPLRLLLGAGLATTLFFCHLVVLALYAACIAGFELDLALRERRLGAAAGRLLVGAASFAVPAILYLLASPTREVARGRITFDGVQKLLSLLVTLTSGVRSADLLTLLVLGLACLLGAVAFHLRLPRGPAFALLLMAVVFAAAPDEVVPAAYIDSRIPIAIFFVAIAAVDIRPRRLVMARLVGTLLATLFLVRVALVTRQWAGFEGMVRAYEAAFAVVPDGATLVAARQIGAVPGTGTAGAADGASSLTRRANDRLRSMLVTNAYEPRLEIPEHMTTLAVLHRPIFVPQVFAIPGIQLLGLRPAYAPIKAVQDNGPIEVATAEELARMVEDVRTAIARTPAAAAPVYILLQHRPGLDPLPLPQGVGVAHQTTNATLLRLAPAAEAAARTPPAPSRRP